MRGRAPCRRRRRPRAAASGAGRVVASPTDDTGHRLRHRPRRRRLVRHRAVARVLPRCARDGGARPRRARRRPTWRRCSAWMRWSSSTPTWMPATGGCSSCCASLSRRGCRLAPRPFDPGTAHVGVRVDDLDGVAARLGRRRHLARGGSGGRSRQRTGTAAASSTCATPTGLSSSWWSGPRARAWDGRGRAVGRDLAHDVRDLVAVEAHATTAFPPSRHGRLP